MTIIKRIQTAGLFLLTLTFFKASVHAQPPFQTPPIAQTQQELAQQALRDARHGNPSSVAKIKDEQGDKALELFANARFDPDKDVRSAAMEAAGDSYPSLLFLLPMLADSDVDIASDVASRVTSISRPQAQFQRLDAAQVVQLVKGANAKNPNFVVRSPEVLLLLAQFKQSPEARALTSKLIKANHWDVSTTTTRPVMWNNQFVTALLARQAIGSITTAQVLRVLKSDAKAREWFAGNINQLTDEALIRYAVSLLQDETVISPGSDDVEENKVSSDVLICFSWATGIDIDYTLVNGVRKYDKKEMRKLFAFYGLQMTPDEEARLTK